MTNKSGSNNIRMRQVGKGSEHVKVSVLALDFILLNLLYYVLQLFLKEHIPHYFDLYTKYTVLVMNFAMLVSEYFFPVTI